MESKSRRSFLKMTTVGTVTSISAAAGGAFAVVKSCIELDDLLNSREEKRINNIKKDLERFRLIREVFFNGLMGNVNFSLSSDHIDWTNWVCLDAYPDSKDTMVSLSSIADIAPNYESCVPEEILKSDGSAIICVGSQASNSATRELMELTKVHDDHTLSINGNILELAYNCSNKPTERLTRKLGGAVVEENNWEILSRNGEALRSVLSGVNKEPTTGYLLFNKLPHPTDPNNASVVWSGNIGPATEAVRLIMEKDQFITNTDLNNILKKVGNSRYYQILFEVCRIQYNDQYKRHFPGAISLVDVAAIV